MTHFICSDSHFCHANIVVFKDREGMVIRPFKTWEEHDEALVDNWNSVVKPGDTVYHLGDVAISRKGLATVRKLNGRKILVKGNHDIFKLKDYTEYFNDIRACIVRDNVVLSHIPLHTSQLDRWHANIHGHLHQNIVLNSDGTPDSRYVNVCMEHTNYTPVPYETLLFDLRQRREQKLKEFIG